MFKKTCILNMNEKVASRTHARFNLESKILQYFQGVFPVKEVHA